MNIAEIKERYSHLPHIKAVWIKNGECYTSPVFGGEKIVIDAIANAETISVTSQPNTETTETTQSVETNSKQSKRKRNGTK